MIIEGKINEEKMIFFVPYPLVFLESGSRVRTIKMYETFKEISYDVFKF